MSRGKDEDEILESLRLRSEERAKELEVERDAKVQEYEAFLQQVLPLPLASVPLQASVFRAGLLV